MLPPEYQIRQTLTNEERYVTQELLEIENRIIRASDAVIQLEQEIFLSLLRETSEMCGLIQGVSELISMMDVLTSFAHRAVSYNYVRPHMIPMGESKELSVVNGRHPVVEHLLASSGYHDHTVDNFVPNSITMGCRTTQPTTQPSEEMVPGSETVFDEIHRNLGTKDADLIFLTGPNAGGKSVYLKQFGVIQLLAQIGSFVPADAARISICNRIFTRVGKLLSITILSLLSFLFQ